MYAAATCCDGIDITLNNLAIREKSCQDILTLCVGIDIAELWCDHGAIDDIEVDIASSKIFGLQLMSNALWRFQGHYFEFPIVGIRARTQNLQMISCHFKVKRLTVHF